MFKDKVASAKFGFDPNGGMFIVLVIVLVLYVLLVHPVAVALAQ